MDAAPEEDLGATLTRVNLAGGLCLVVIAPIGEVTAWMFEGGVYRTTFVYWQNVDGDDFNDDLPVYNEQPGALRGEQIRHAESIGLGYQRTIAKARAAQRES